MATAKKKAADFLSAMEETGVIATPEETAAPAPTKAKDRTTLLRQAADKRHFGAYLDQPTLERAALLKARLRLDNGQLMQHALDLLWREVETARKFDDKAA